MASEATTKRPRLCVGCRQRKKAVFRRGLCPNCAVKAYRAVSAGKVTWAELVAEGVALEAATGKPRTPLGEKIARIARRGAAR